MEVNLSRIHALYNQTSVDIRRIMDEATRPLEENGEDFMLRIFEGTSDEDITTFLAKLASKRKRIERAFEEASQVLEYSFYLRRSMDAANRASGVAEKLLEQANIKKKLAHLYGIRKIISLSCSRGLDELKDAAYYKSSFTDQQKYYDLPLRMFKESDLDKLMAEINETERAAFDVANEIATLNQTTLIDIQSFEAFKAEKK